MSVWEAKRVIDIDIGADAQASLSIGFRSQPPQNDYVRLSES